MQPGEFFTWNRVLEVGVINGRLPPEELRARTLSFVYFDRVRNYDHIEWTLDNSDGLLTRPEYLAAGLMVRVRLGYPDAAIPWRAFIINRVQGGVGVYGRDRAAVGEREAKVTYHGRNRNAPGGRNSRPWSMTAKAPPKKPKKTYGPTTDITKHEMTLEDGLPHIILAQTTSQAVEEIARRNGFEGSFALIQPTEDPIEGGKLVIPEGVSDAQFLQQLAALHAYVFKVDDDGLHWHSSHWAGAKHRIVDRLIYGQTPDILELWLDADFRLPIPTGVTAKGYSWRRRAMQVHNGSFDADQKEMNIGLAYIDLMNDQARAAAITRQETIPVLADSQPKAKQKALQQFIDRHLQAFIINVKTVGNPKLLAGKLVDIRGTGSTLIDRTLYISEARHDISELTYTTQLKLKHPPRTHSGSITVGHVHNPKYDSDQKGLNLGTFYVRSWPFTKKGAGLR